MNASMTASYTRRSLLTVICEASIESLVAADARRSTGLIRGTDGPTREADPVRQLRPVGRRPQGSVQTAGAALPVNTRPGRHRSRRRHRSRARRDARWSGPTY